MRSIMWSGSTSFPLHNLYLFPSVYKTPTDGLGEPTPLRRPCYLFARAGRRSLAKEGCSLPCLPPIRFRLCRSRFWIKFRSFFTASLPLSVLCSFVEFWAGKRDSWPWNNGQKKESRPKWSQRANQIWVLSFSLEIMFLTPLNCFLSAAYFSSSPKWLQNPNSLRGGI